MEPITSGSTTERIVRTTLVTFLAIGAAGWCFYDAFVGYPMENLRRAVKDLTPQPEVSSKLIAPAVNQASVDGMTGSTKFQKDQIFLKDLVARFGEPGWRGLNARGKPEARFFGPAGQAIATLNPAEGVASLSYEPSAYKPELDLAFQKWMGLAIALIAVLLLIHWFRVVFVRATMTEEGIKLTGRPLVPFGNVTALYAEQYAKKGWLDLEYEKDGQTGCLRLDDYKIKAFPTIVAEICRRKGYEDPYQKWQEQKRAAARPK